MTLLNDAVAAYLSPLLKKHASDELITWEDLESSQQAANLVLTKAETPNPFVSKRVETLHQSQVYAYREAATKAIKEWAMGFPLQPMDDSDSEQTFVDRCASALVLVQSPKDANSWPNWKLENAKILAIDEIRKRAKAIFEKYRGMNEDGDNSHDGDDGLVDEDSEESGVQIDEDDEQRNEAENEAGATSAASNRKEQQTKMNRRKTQAKSTTVRKKSTPAKGYRNKGQSARGGRRGGRGGGNTRINGGDRQS